MRSVFLISVTLDSAARFHKAALDSRLSAPIQTRSRATEITYCSFDVGHFNPLCLLGLTRRLQNWKPKSFLSDGARSRLADSQVQRFWGGRKSLLELLKVLHFTVVLKASVSFIIVHVEHLSLCPLSPSPIQAERNTAGVFSRQATARVLVLERKKLVHP